MIITDKEQGVQLIEGRTHTYAQYRHFSIYYGIRLAFLDSNGQSVDKLTQNLGFNIRFHLYIHEDRV